MSPESTPEPIGSRMASKFRIRYSISETIRLSLSVRSLWCQMRKSAESGRDYLKLVEWKTYRLDNASDGNNSTIRFRIVEPDFIIRACRSKSSLERNPLDLVIDASLTLYST